MSYQALIAFPRAAILGPWTLGAGIAIVGSTSFELRSFSYRGTDRLDLCGRWHGIDDSATGVPTLMVAGGGAARALLASEAAPGEAPEPTGHLWRVSFSHAGEPTTITHAELLVPPAIAVTLPPPASEDARHFGRVMLPARRVSSDTEAEDMLGPWAEVARLQRMLAVAEDAVTREHARSTAEITQLRTKLREARGQADRLAEDVRRDERVNAARATEVDQLVQELAEMTRLRDEAEARMRQDLDPLREASERLEAARRQQAEDVDRLSATVESLRAGNERLVIEHRATLRALAAELELALDRVETVAADSAAHAQAALARLDDAPDARALTTVTERLEAIMRACDAAADMVGGLRRHIRRLDPSKGRWRATGR